MHQVKITIECTKDDDAKWGSTTTHEVRELDYAQLVTFQRELFEGLGAMLVGYGEQKVTASVAPPVTTTYAR